MPSWGQRERSVLTVENTVTGEKYELPSFTCSHCNRVVVQHPERDRPRNVCRKCDALTCDYCAGLECYDFQRDLELAYSAGPDDHPYLLRGLRADGADAGEPVRRVETPYGATLALARDIGYTDRAMAKLWRPSDGAAR